MTEKMIYIVDNILNYLIYLFILCFGFQLRPRENKIFLGLSVLIMLSGGIFNAYFDTNSPFVYMLWSVLAVVLFFKERVGRLFLLSVALMYFTGIVDTFSVMLIQIVLIGGGCSVGIAWWMESAYLLSFLVYFLMYWMLLRKNEVYLNEIALRYLFALLIQGSIFQMFYNLVFTFFNENQELYGWDAYAVFFISIVGAIYSLFLTLSLAIKNIVSKRQNKELQSFMHMQKEQYDYQLKQTESVRRFKHDLTNHVGALRELVSQEKMEEAKAYIDTIWNLQNEFELKIHTGDSFLDVIMNYYLYLAMEKNIEFTVTGKFSHKLHLEMFDITTLVGNILQNALEASVKATNPKIRVELIEHKKEIFLVVSNSVAAKINIKKGIWETSKADKANHGFGMKNIVAIVEKCGGEYYMESIEENGDAMFKISISIPRGSML